MDTETIRGGVPKLADGDQLPGHARVDCSHFAGDRPYVECLIGRFQRTFSILRDNALRLEWSRLETRVTLCVAGLNSHRPSRGFALCNPLLVSSAQVPISADPPPRASLRGLARPPAPWPDARVGFTPDRAFQILRARRQEVQLPRALFAVPYTPTAAAGEEDADSDGSPPPE
jgi:hypothetical protein